MLVKFALSLSRIYQHFGNNPFAIVSAYLSGDPDNEERAAVMKQAVRRMGYGYREIQGAWIELEGPHAGEKLTEYPLFIPMISYEDALYLAQGGYFDRKPQYSFIYSDGHDVAEIETVPEAVRQEFHDFKANDLESLWKYFSEFRGKKFRFSSVRWDMIMPPPQHPKGAAEHRAHYSNDERTAHQYVWRRSDLLRDAAVARRRRIEARTGSGSLEYTVVRPAYRDRIVYRKERRPFLLSPDTRNAKAGRWSPSRFSAQVRMPERVAEMWNVNPRNLLLSRGEYDNKPVERISWHPLTGEMLLSAKGESYHAHDIHNFGSKPFDEYVRAIVLPDKKRVVVRPWWPFNQSESMRLDPGEPEIISFEAQDALRRVLVRAGMPKSWTFEYDGTNTRLEQLTKRRNW
jgi:hypothetical protein